MDNKQLLHIQGLLLSWISYFEKRSYTSIKESCLQLLSSNKLDLSNPVEDVFKPLLLNGLVDFAGNGYYSVAEPLVVDCKTHFYYINHIPTVNIVSSGIVGIYRSMEKPKETVSKTIRVNVLSILQHFPNIKDIVNEFNPSLTNLHDLEFYGHRNSGVAKYKTNGIIKIFYDPFNSKLYEIPGRNVNPESLSIAFCYSRVMNNEPNGYYNQKSSILRIPVFAMPFSIYRVLLLESMNNDFLPTRDGKYHIFNNVSSDIASELNRIFCNSLKYE